MRTAIATRSPSHVVVTASFLGRRRFSRFDIEDAAGEEIARVLDLPYRSRRSGLPEPGGFEWRVHIVEDRARIGLRVADHPLHRRAYKRAAPPGTTHPPVAAAMVRLAHAGPGRLLWDPACGAGTIPIEARILNGEVAAGGSEIDPTTATSAQLNVKAARLDCPILVADAMNLPLRDGSVGALVANLPWGRQASRQGRLHGMHDLLHIADRVLEGDGVVTLLAEEGTNPGLSAFELVAERRLSLMGSHPALRLWRRR